MAIINGDFLFFGFLYFLKGYIKYNDVLVGTDRDDQIDGKTGDDTIYGGKGNDYLSGGENGNNYLNGGDGDDTLSASYGHINRNNIYGNNYLDGGYGNDQIFGGYGNDTILGGDGNDVIDGGAGIDKISGGNGNDKIYAGVTLEYEVHYRGIYKTPMQADLHGRDTIDGGSGNDTIYGQTTSSEIYGGIGNDLIIGGNLGFGGFYSGGFYVGQEGNDIIYGSNNNDYIDGGTGDDLLIARGGKDSLLGGSGNDTLIGGSYTEYYNFYNYDPTSYNEIFHEEEGDFLTGGEGADKFYIYKTAENIKIKDFRFSEGDKILIIGTDKVISSFDYNSKTITLWSNSNAYKVPLAILSNISTQESFVLSRDLI